MKRYKHLFLSLIALAAMPLWGASDEFPHRAKFPEVKTMEIEQLHERRDKVIIFDVRSAYEYETLHIKGARHLALNNKQFAEELKALRASEKAPFVFYCNGHTCKKSYQAVRLAQRAGVSAIYAYDAGVFSWVNSYPEESVLMGKSPVDKSKLISKQRFSEHLMEPEKFGLTVGSNTLVIDIRDEIQKEGTNLFPMQQHSVPLDNGKLQGYVERAKRENKALLVYDAVGKQVRWLQYYLEEQQVKNYYFMAGGVRAFLNY